MRQPKELDVIAYIETDFHEKFGIPRQSGLADTKGTIVFTPAYRNPDALRGIEDYSHLWIIWGFSKAHQKEFKATVRPPRLGGNERVGVFATRSPFRPNGLGLSCVKLDGIEERENVGKVLCVSGVDMLNKTPIYDIKPYLPYVDSYPGAEGGFAEEKKEHKLEVEIPDELLHHLPKAKIMEIRQILEQDPRPAYQNDPDRVYGMEYGGLQIRFQIDGNRLRVSQICGSI